MLYLKKKGHERPSLFSLVTMVSHVPCMSHQFTLSMHPYHDLLLRHICIASRKGSFWQICANQMLLCLFCTVVCHPHVTSCLQAFSCEVCSSMRPSSSSAAQQEDGPSTSFQANGDTSQGEAKGKKKGKAPKFERLRVTGTTLMHVAFS